MLSRRHFLQLAGITLASASLPGWTTTFINPAAQPMIAPTLETVYGRAFATTRVYAAPSIAAPITERLWANTVAPILDSEGKWYRLTRGYVLRENMQPMIAAAQRSDTTFRPPFWAEVSGAIGIVRATCDANSEIVRRIGHGGVLRVIDWLPGDGFDWYGVASSENGDLLGWTQASLWSLVEEVPVSPSLSISVNTTTQQMTVYEGNHALLTAPISTNSALHPGTYAIYERQVVQGNYSHNAPWSLTFGEEFRLSGVYWHNQFGKAASGAAVQVTPPLARWLYPRAAEVIVY